MYWHKLGATAAIPPRATLDGPFSAISTAIPAGRILVERALQDLQKLTPCRKAQDMSITENENAF